MQLKIENYLIESIEFIIKDLITHFNECNEKKIPVEESKLIMLEYFNEYFKNTNRVLNDNILGFHMFNFNDNLPDDGKRILFLLGNCLDSSVKMVTTIFNKEDMEIGGDYAKNDNGKFKHVSYWRYTN